MVEDGNNGRWNMRGNKAGKRRKGGRGEVKKWNKKGEEEKVEEEANRREGGEVGEEKEK